MTPRPARDSPPGTAFAGNFAHRSAAALQAALLAIVLAGALAACSPERGHSTQEQTLGRETQHRESLHPETLHRGLGGEPATLDPAAATDTYSTQVLQDLYEGLTTESAGGVVAPGVASSWTVDATGKRYTFQLRADARWSNGKAVRAQEFVDAWRRVTDPAQASPVADDLRIIEGAAAIIAGERPPATLGVAAVGDSVLVVTLAQPAPYLPQLLAHSSAYPIFSAAAAHAHTPQTWVSNGPYALEQWLPGTEVALTRNEHYWDQVHVGIERVVYHVASDPNSQLTQYRAGQLDLTDTVPPNAIPELRRHHSQELLIAPFLATAYYGLNVTQPPFAAHPGLRQALAMAIDRPRLVTALGFGQSEAYGLVPPGTWNYQPQVWPWQGLDDATRIAAAKRLYAEAGYSPESPLRLRLLINANSAIKQTALMIAAMWKETLGIDTELTEEEYRVFLQSRHDRSRWDVVRLAWDADFNDAGNFLDAFRALSPNNDAGYRNIAFDTLMDAASRAADPRHRREFLETGERLMLSEYPIVPLYHFVSKRLVKPYIEGVRPDPFNRVPSKGLAVLAHE